MNYCQHGHAFSNEEAQGYGWRCPIEGSEISSSSSDSEPPAADSTAPADTQPAGRNSSDNVDATANSGPDLAADGNNSDDDPSDADSSAVD